MIYKYIKKFYKKYKYWHTSLPIYSSDTNKNKKQQRLIHIFDDIDRINLYNIINISLQYNWDLYYTGSIMKSVNHKLQLALYPVYYKNCNKIFVVIKITKLGYNVNKDVFEIGLEINEYLNYLNKIQNKQALKQLNYLMNFIKEINV